MLTPEKLRDARSLFPHTQQGKIYLNHAGTSPLSTRVVEAMTAYLHERSHGRLETYFDDLPMVAECRSFVQRLINAESPDRIALCANTSDAINIVASGIQWKSGDRIVLNEAEFPANVWPFLNLKRFGVELDIVATGDGIVTPSMIAHATTPKTRLVALSAVQFLDGYRANLAAIGDFCRENGIIFAVDGIQAVGAVVLDVQHMKIDALSAGGQKWQMSPHGTGFLYLTGELQSRIQQTNLGWLSAEDPWNFHNFTQPLASTARRYEGGSLNMPGLWGMRAALSTILEFDPKAIELHILAITRTLMDGLRQIDGVRVLTPDVDAQRAGIVTVSPPPGIDETAVFKAMYHRQITIAVREGKFRFSPHFYCSAEDMQATVEALKECLKS